ncbi:orotidine 5'-phosphate decarboxylase [Microbacterium nanhaiense]|uniref:Orotidine 5'-phosphate decarboxylase n=1 Tax=Microbacterium nanhaiense TaxID=1301026 RepID=A0ABQ2MZP0_9MICO|nr:orotidine-5'-phosphate decarboxylase [Microbacterium nanhaiense]GGO61814.1 orotidine 5'-phosphate decarboxylase [Microbacterium nanhaiense]
MTTSFGQRARTGIDRFGPLCVGIDPHEGLLDEWGLPRSSSGARDFGLRVVEAAAGRAAFVKPQVSFFERYGSAGIGALEDVMSAARAAGILVIADAKRGDIGSTMDAYASAWLTPGSPLEADALTVSPYLGVGAVRGTIELAYRHGKGVFVLATTSNPEAEGLQRSTDADGRTVSQRVIDEVSEINAAHAHPGEWASAGFVIGATVDWSESGIRPYAPIAPILAPGFGHQGARPQDARRIFGAMSDAVIVSESRSILSAGSGKIDSVVEDHARAARAAGEPRGSEGQEQEIQ